MKIMLCLSLVIFSLSCNTNEKENVVGGPCSYDEQVFPATLIKTVPQNKLEYEAVFTLENGKNFTESDTIYYSRLNNNHYLSSTELPWDSLVTGTQYSYIVKNIRLGDCDPHIESISLQPYTGK